MAVPQNLMCTSRRSACHPLRPCGSPRLLLLCPPAGEERPTKSLVLEAVCAFLLIHIHKACVDNPCAYLSLFVSSCCAASWRHLPGPQCLTPSQPAHWSARFILSTPSFPLGTSVPALRPSLEKQEQQHKHQRRHHANSEEHCD